MSDQPDLGPDVDIDEVLAAIDPEFKRSMTELGAIESGDVDLEVSHLDVEVEGDAPDLIEAPPADAPFAVRAKYWARRALFSGIALARRAIEFTAFAMKAFKSASRAKKAMTFGLVGLLALGFAILKANVRGAWIPNLNAPVVGRFAPYADHVEAVEASEPRVRLDLAFPPERHEFLFKPFKVNLTATADNPHPMGAFEFVISVDSAETATEARDREVELKDLVQRVFEAQTFPDLETERGKERLKNDLRAEIEQKLGLKRVLAVSFKTFVLKP